MVEASAVQGSALLVAGAVGTSVGAFLLLTARTRVGRFLGFLLVLEMGLWALLQGAIWVALGARWLDEFSALHAGLVAATGVAWAAPGPLYLLFGIYAVDWRPLQHARRPSVVAGCFLASFALVVSTLYLLKVGITAGPSGRQLWFFVNLPDVVKGLAGFAVLVFVLLFLRAQPGPAARRRAIEFLVAFGVRDALWLGQTILVTAQFATGTDIIPADWFFGILFAGLAVFSIIIARAVLRGTILDLPRRLHVGVARTTVGAAFLAVFVGVQTLVSEFVAGSVGLLAGAASAALLVLVIAPLQRAARSFADRAVPGGRIADLAEPERATFYREQVAIAYSDGFVGAKERSVLKAIRERLRISAQVAVAIEDEVASARVPA